MIINILAYVSAGLSVVVAGSALFIPALRKPIAGVISQATVVLCILVSLTLRSFEMGYIALTGMFDSLFFFALVIFFISLWLNIQSKISYPQAVQFGAVLFALGLMLVATSPIINKEALPPIPALQSGWLILHVAFSFIGEAFLVFSFVTSLLLLLNRDEEKIRVYDALSYRGIVVGYSFFTLGALIFGAIWAENAWGRFWAWDPKETWALITWLIYSVYLHFRLIRKANHRVCAWISVLGFLATMFTFFGVNYLLSIGLHSY